MKNKGLLTRRGIDLANFKRDPIPEVLDNRRMADPSDPPAVAAPDPTHVSASPNPVEPPEASPADVARPTSGARRTQVSSAKSRSSTPNRPKQAVTSTDDLRFTLSLKITESADRKIAALLASQDSANVSATRRSIITAFKAHLLEKPVVRSAPPPSNAVTFRIDIRLAKDLVDQIGEVQKRHVFEAPSSFVSSYLGPLFSKFIEASLPDA